jgi:hypothetical protein
MSFDRNVSRKPCLVGGVKGHNMNKTSFADILFATGVSGKPGRRAGSFNQNENLIEGNQKGINRKSLPFLKAIKNTRN